MYDNRVKVALYDAKQKKLIGIFDSLSTCGKYVFGDKHCASMAPRLSYAKNKRQKVYHEGNAYAVRTASVEQIEKLGEYGYLIESWARQPTISQMKGYSSDRKCLLNEWNIRIEAYDKERNRKKEESKYLK